MADDVKYKIRNGNHNWQLVVDDEDGKRQYECIKCDAMLLMFNSGKSVRNIIFIPPCTNPNWDGRQPDLVSPPATQPPPQQDPPPAPEPHVSEKEPGLRIGKEPGIGRTL